jgi:AraC-like DNA-binding protein
MKQKGSKNKQIMKFLSKPIYIPSLHGTYHFIDEERLHVKRKILPKTFHRYPEVIGTGWFLGRAKSNNSNIETRTTTGIKKVLNNMILYAPPFSLPDFYLYPGEIELEFIVIKSNPPENMPLYPCIFSSISDIDILELSKDLLAGKIISPIYNLNYDSQVSSLALRAKKMLDLYYRDPIKISDIAIKLKTSSAVLTRYFKSSFHITPLQYLNEIRVKDALLIILGEKKGVLETSLNLGFNDQRQLYENFKKLFKSPPSHLQGAKKRKASVSGLYQNQL